MAFAPPCEVVVPVGRPSFWRRTFLPLAALVLPALALPAPTQAAEASTSGAGVTAAGGRSPWPGEEMPLPLSVKTSQDLAMKAVAERQYLIFNLLAGGKVSWDSGDYATAARKWDELLRLPTLDPETERIVRPFAAEARNRAAKSGARSGATKDAPLPFSMPLTSIPQPSTSGSPMLPFGASPPSEAGELVRPALVTVSGSVRGGGARGPAGTVLWLRRLDGPNPRPRAGRPKVVSQTEKNFVPHVTVVTPGTPVLLRNDDNIFHNVFSALGPNQFDSGLYKKGTSYTKAFTTPGPVELLCNIHSSMLGWVYVVDSPHYALSTRGGDFKIANVPPGKYQLEAWNEAATKTSRQTVEIGPEGVRGLTITVGHDKQPARFVADKYGNPRQPQLGY